MNEVIAVVSVLACIACAVLVVLSMRREIVSSWILFLLMSMFDMFLPAALTAAGFEWSAHTMDSRWEWEWVAPTAKLMVGRAVLIAIVATVLFGLGYYVGGLFQIEKRAQYRFCRRRAWLLFLLGASGYLVFFLSQLAMYGSLSALLDYFVSHRFAGAAPEGGYTLMAVSFDIYLLEIIALIFFEQARSKRARFTWFLCGLVVSGLRLFRGSVLVYLLAIAVLEQETIHRLGSRFARSLKEGRTRRRIYAFVAIGVVLFTGYGIVRNVLTSRSGHAEISYTEALFVEADRAIRGEGLVGLASILDFYPRNGDFFHGKTIGDMLLLPVPRVIWTSKPSWYGMSDITLRMGWPGGTGSPVSMPGELYANFGYPGILLMFVYGLIFGAFATFAHNPRLRFLYALILLPAMLTTFWMGFTGLMNSLVVVPFGMLTVFVVLRPLRLVRMRTVHRDLPLSPPLYHSGRA